MKKYTYKFVDGTKNIVEVSDFFYDILTQMDEEEKFNFRRETRRHISYNEFAEYAIEPAVEDEYDYGELFQDLPDKGIFLAIRELDKNKKDLLYKVYYQRKSLKEIAEEEKVTPQAISWRLRRILWQLQTKR